MVTIRWSKTSRHTGASRGHGPAVPAHFRPAPIIAALRAPGRWMAGRGLLLGALALVPAGQVSAAGISGSAVFPEQDIVSNTADRAYSVSGADLDGDGDLDLLSASFFDGKIAWYENDGASVPGFTERTITTAASGAASVFAIDLDGDGDMDVLSASFYDSRIAWYENSGAADPTFTPRIVSETAGGALGVFAIDVDGDGDADVLSASFNDGRIVWYENDGGQSFTAHEIASVGQARSVFAIDLDGDGDTDALSASGGGNLIAWYENDGNENFTLRSISNDAQNAGSVFAADLDGDGDLDVLSASFGDNKVAWYQNDGNENFTARVISFAADGPYSVRAADLDGDGDMDVLSASFRDDKVAWYENDGEATPGFTTRIITTSADVARSVFSADVDGDGDIDVASASAGDDTISVFRNRGGQFALDTLDLAPAAVVAGQLDVPVLRIDAFHRGRAGEPAIRLTNLALAFGDASSTPLTSGQANALVDSLAVYRDDGDTEFDSAVDTLVTRLDSLSLVSGLQSVNFAENDPNASFAFGATPTFFVALDLAPNADTQTPDALRVAHIAEASTATDAGAGPGSALRLEFPISVASGVLAPTANPDPTPDQFTFVAVSNVALGSTQVSNAVAINGVVGATTISVTGGAYSVGCTGSFTALAGSVSNGDSVCVRHTAAAGFGSATSTTLTVGGVSDTFVSATRVANTAANVFTFIDQTNVLRNSVRTSNAVIITGIEAAAPISVQGGVYSIGCTGNFTATAATISSGQTVCVRQLSATGYNSSVNTILTIGGVSDTFTTVTTPNFLAGLLGVTFQVIGGAVGGVLGLVGNLLSPP